MIVEKVSEHVRMIEKVPDDSKISGSVASSQHERLIERNAHTSSDLRMVERTSSVDCKIVEKVERVSEYERIVEKVDPVEE